MIWLYWPALRVDTINILDFKMYFAQWPLRIALAKMLGLTKDAFKV